MSVPDGRFAPISTPIGSAPEKATMQLLHQTCRSRIDRLNDAGVTAGWSGKYGDQQWFSASTSSDTSSVRQKRYDDTIDPCKEYWYYVESVSTKGSREKFTPTFHAPAKRRAKS